MSWKREMRLRTISRYDEQTKQVNNARTRYETAVNELPETPSGWDLIAQGVVGVRPHLQCHSVRKIAR